MEESEFIKKTCSSGRGGWLKEELISICNSLNISSIGNKEQLCNTIKQYYSNTDVQLKKDKALIISSENGDIDTVKYLIQNGANIHTQDDESLIISVRKGHLDIVKYLISVGGDIHLQDNILLRLSSQEGHLEIVKYLISVGANIHAGDDYSLIVSSQNGHLDIVKYLISVGANIHSQDDYALRFSAQEGYLEIVKYLISVGANIHADNDQPLILSAQEGYLQIVKYLIEQGANIHAKNDKAVMLSSYRGHLDIVKYLIENGANIHSDNEYALVSSAQNGYLDIVKYLISVGADIHAQDDRSLRISAENGHLDIVKYLIENGANIHVQDDYALRFSAENGHLDIVKYLKSKTSKFKKSIYKIHNKVKNQKYYYKWQEMCKTLDNKNLLELQDLSILHNISITNKSKRELCKDLAIQYEQELINFDTTKCHNEYTILGDPVNLIPKPLLYNLKEGNQVYCFNIIELIEMINKNDLKNPFTRVLLPIDDIKKRMLILRQTLIEDKLSLVNILEEIKNNKIMTTESILKLQIVNLIALLNYTPNVDIIANINQSQINLMFNYLNENPLTKVYGKHTKSNLIMESLRILNIDDSNSGTRKTAYEIYLNQVFQVDTDEHLLPHSSINSAYY